VTKFQRSYDSDQIPAQLRHHPAAAIGSRHWDCEADAPTCRYVALDGSGRVVLAGLARLAEDSTFRVDLKGKLQPGHYTVEAAAYLNGNTMNAEIRRIPVEIPAR
jgi:hypothetical protein